MPAPVSPPAGFAVGAITIGRLADAGIRVTGWRWVYRPSLHREGGQFPPHRALAGTFHDQIPTAEGFFPRDHAVAGTGPGCLCDVAPVLRSERTGRFTPPPEQL